VNEKNYNTKVGSKRSESVTQLYGRVTSFTDLMFLDSIFLSRKATPNEIVYNKNRGHN
jgi:hypothetical protein